MEKHKRITASLLVTGILLTGASASDSESQFVPASSSSETQNSANKPQKETVKPKPFKTEKYNVLVGAGDIARCDSKADEKTAKLIKKIKGVVFTAGDNVYPNGSIKNFKNCYDPSWGDFKWRTKAVIGNHDTYPDHSQKVGADRAYFDYFGQAAGPRGKGYYSYDLAEGKWHVIVINSNREYNTNSEQARWLRQDLAKHKDVPKIAIWHHPLFTAGAEPGSKAFVPLWKELAKNDTKVVINGHAHSYQRFAPQTADGKADPKGIREFVVGTGGARLKPLRKHKNLEASNNKTYGVFKLTLKENSYSWNFIPIKGQKFKDSGTQVFESPKSTTQ